MADKNHFHENLLSNASVYPEIVNFVAKLNNNEFIFLERHIKEISISRHKEAVKNYLDNCKKENKEPQIDITLEDGKKITTNDIRNSISIKQLIEKKDPYVIFLLTCCAKYEQDKFSVKK